MIPSYWVAEVSASPGNQDRAQPRRGVPVEHIYADTNRRSSLPTAERSAMS